MKNLVDSTPRLPTDWAGDLARVPRVPLAHLPTPLERPTRLLGALLGSGGGLDRGRPDLPDLMIKRDDLTGAELTGNKVRKLEFLLAQAQAQGADTVITCGGVQSNHCRATALAAARLGLRSVLLLRTADGAPPPSLAGEGGNLLLDRLCGAQIRYVTPQQYRDRMSLMTGVADDLLRAGQRGYIIPEGGSNALGCLGYAAAVAELAEQVPAGPLTLVHATGSGGTGAGLLLGVALLGLPWRVVGVNVCDDRDYFVRVTSAILVEAATGLGLSAAAGRLAGRLADGLIGQPDRFEILDGYVGRGYALSRPEELALIRDVCRAEGLVLDPVYTGKAMFAMIDRLRQDPRSLGERIVFVHTGGLFGLFGLSSGAAELALLLNEAGR